MTSLSISEFYAPLLTKFPQQGDLPKLELLAAEGTEIDYDDVQGDILVGMRKNKEAFFFFHIIDAATFKTALKTNIDIITSTTEILKPVPEVKAFVNVAFSSKGLKALGITDNLQDKNFTDGQLHDAKMLGDILGNWEPSFTGGDIDGVFLIGSQEQPGVDAMLVELSTIFGASIQEVTTLNGAARSGDNHGHEHFGFLDGISNPVIHDWTKVEPALPGQAVVPNGIILTGQKEDPKLGSRPTWAKNGSFLVFRKLKQLVGEFNDYLAANALKEARDDITGRTVKLTPQAGAELLGARMFGRWKSGAPIDLCPLEDDPALGADPLRNNDFTYAHPAAIFDFVKDQTRCPFSAHTRKTRPRADLYEDNMEQKKSQAIRASIPYGSDYTPETANEERGLAFVEYQSVIAEGFIKQQLLWSNNKTFPHNKSSKEVPGLDGIVGQAPHSGTSLVPTQRIVGGLNPMNDQESSVIPAFVIPRGGEYFFSPSIGALKNTITA